VTIEGASDAKLDGSKVRPLELNATQTVLEQAEVLSAVWAAA